ncbi:U3 small nucleolar RNA-interacting protein 2 [Drosophila pseudoobscura]|uniref:U3 small nucleolar RNA-interacting protein 2 n=1 Tax=Drosophila pseudoobscura pseudoobscura TaxID=46245 RepID=A0A6I8UVS4_DROPS|nr:U3 small nucleolar RNA-interacting protein 2 [Drosophila pseudoobscura]
MSSSFFLKAGGKANKKRKNPAATKGKGVKTAAKSGKSGFQNARAEGPVPKKQRRPKEKDEEIESDDEEYNSDLGDGGHNTLAFSSDEGEEETAQDKRLRLAKQYLSEIEKQESERAEDRELGQSVEQRLQTDYLDSVGKLRRNIAGNLKTNDVTCVLKHKLHHMPICALALSPDGKFLYAGAKSQFVLKWSTQNGKVLDKCDVLPHREEPETGKKRRSHVIAICLSTDMKYMALAEGGPHIQIWCPQTMKHVKTLKGHRDSVAGLVFRKGTHDLYSAAKDRSVKIWSLDEMAYVESLFGHQTGVTSIDALSRERAITAGGSDCSLRIWKITEESQLIYNGHRDSIECVKLMNDEHFVSGGVDGAISLWSALKKKPICTTQLAHGVGENGVANWITAIAVVVNTDLVATGSCDGFVKLWQTNPNARKLQQIQSIPITGFINGLTFNADGTKLYVGVGQEHRLGRWWRHKEAKNNVVVVDIVLQNATGK